VFFPPKKKQPFPVVWSDAHKKNRVLRVGMHSRLGDDHPAITVANQYTRTCLVENAARRSHVCRKAGFRLLDNSYRVTVTLENVRDRLPSRTIGEGAVDQNDSLDGCVRRE